MSNLIFVNPPVIRVVFVIKFEELTDFSSVHFGLYWETIRTDFPSFSDVLPTTEDDSLTLPPLRRVVFSSEDGTESIILHNTSFAYQWDKQNNSYPSFEKLSKRFFEQWENFKQWSSMTLNTDNVEKSNILVSNCVLSYLNIITEESGLLNPPDYSRMFTFFSDNWQVSSIQPDGFSFSLTFKLPDDVGLLNMEINQGYIESDENSQMDAMMFGLYIQPQETFDDSENLPQWFAIAHQQITKYFLDFIHNELLEKWGIQS